MNITREAVTVLPNAGRGEVDIILAGLRITLTADKSLLLAAGLANSLEQLQGIEQGEAAASDIWEVDRAAPVAPDPRAGSSGKEAATEAEVLLRTRALIQASMRDKGLSLREAERE